MQYLDASAAVPLFVKGASSPAIRRLFADVAPCELVLSGWTVAGIIGLSEAGERQDVKTSTKTPGYGGAKVMLFDIESCICNIGNGWISS